MAALLEAPQDATREHNVKARADEIRDSFGEIYKLRMAARAAIEKHVVPLRAQVADIKKRLKDDYQIGGKALNARYSVYELERFAEDGSDDSTQDLIKELFTVLPIGAMLDLADLADVAAGVVRGAGPVGMPKDKRGARAAGRRAAEENRGDVCPYVKKSGALAKAWRQGYSEGKAY